jgi:hypothetical protein
LGVCFFFLSFFFWWVGYSLVSWIWPKSIFLLLSQSSQTFLACLPACLLTFWWLGWWDLWLQRLSTWLPSFQIAPTFLRNCFIKCCCSYLVQNCDESHFLENFMKHFFCEWVQSFHFYFFPLWVQFLGTNFMEHFVIF